MTDAVDTKGQPEQAVEQGAATRRSLLSKGAIAAAVGAAAGIALSEQTSAANGSNFVIGNVGSSTNTATNTTRLEGGSSLAVVNGTSGGDASIYGFADDTGAKYGVHGRHIGTNGSAGVAGVHGSALASDVAGVYGVHEGADTQPGNGVLGESEFGVGVYGTNTASGNSGWGVRGENSGTSGGGGVRGDAVGTKAAGVYGRAVGTDSAGVEGQSTALGGTGVAGEHVAAAPSETGTGVQGTSDNGVGVRGSGTTYDFQAAGTGIVYISAKVNPAITPTSAGTVGSIARSDDDSLWYCYAPNQWRQLDAASADPVLFNPVTPFRVYDSRQEADGAFTGDENRTISVADSRDVATYAVVTADAVPAGATAVTGNVVAIGTSDPGFLSINPGGTTAISAASLNWVAGQIIGNAGTFTLNASREVEVVFGPGNGCHVTLDITGYYL